MKHVSNYILSSIQITNSQQHNQNMGHSGIIKKKFFLDFLTTMIVFFKENCGTCLIIFKGLMIKIIQKNKFGFLIFFRPDFLKKENVETRLFKFPKNKMENKGRVKYSPILSTLNFKNSIFSSHKTMEIIFVTILYFF
jgi:hypothetical protein